MGFFQRLFGRRRSTPPDPQWQVPVVNEIIVAMIRLVPEEWESVYLVLEVTDKGIGSGLAHSAITRKLSKDSALRDGDFVMPDMDVMAATRKLELGWVERQSSFKRAIISAVRDEAGWAIRSEYEHED